MHASDFEYDGVRLSDIGYTICDFDDNDYQTVTNGSEIVFNTVSTLHGAKFERASSEYDDYLTTTFQICKNQCDREGLEISIHEFRHLMRWLNRKQFHKFKFIDDEWLGFYYEGSFNLSRIESEDKIVGVELELTTNRPYGLMEPRKVFIYAVGEPFAFYSKDDNSLTFSCDVLPRVWDTYNDKTVTNVYTGLKNTGTGSPPWYDIRSSVKTVEFTDLFANCAPLSCHQWFYEFANCTSFTGLEYLNTSRTTDMAYMFFQCANATELDVSEFDTSNVTNMTYMFASCCSVTELDVTSFETYRVTSLEGMFNDCQSLTELDLRSFNTSNVKNMGDMFCDCQALETIYANDKSFIIDNVTNSIAMFYNCINLVGGKGTVFDYRRIDAQMAHADTTTNPGYFTGIATQGLISNSIRFAIYSSDDDSLTFYGDNKLPSCGEQYNDKTVTAVFDNLEDCGIAIAPWYWYRTDIKTVNFTTSFSVARPTSCYRWFDGFENCTAFDGMMNFNTSSVTNMQDMFASCTSLTALDLSWLDTSSATIMYDMFSECHNLAALDVSNFNTSNVTNMAFMFCGCISLTTIDVSGFDTSNVTNMESMFDTCTSLTTIYSNDSVFVRDAVTHGLQMFENCVALVGGNGTVYDADKTGLSMAHIDAYDNPGYFTSYTERKTYRGINYVLRDFSDEEGFIYPLVEIKVLKDGNLTIYNEMEDRATTINNCTKGEVITMDSPVITSSYAAHKLQNDFNWNFLRVANRMHNRDNKLIITLPCTIKLIYSPVAKVGL